MYADLIVFRKRGRSMLPKISGPRREAMGVREYLMRYG